MMFCFFKQRCWLYFSLRLWGVVGLKINLASGWVFCGVFVGILVNRYAAPDGLFFLKIVFFDAGGGINYLEFGLYIFWLFLATQWKYLYKNC